MLRPISTSFKQLTVFIWSFVQVLFLYIQVFRVFACNVLTFEAVHLTFLTSSQSFFFPLQPSAGLPPWSCSSSLAPEVKDARSDELRGQRGTVVEAGDEMRG